MSLQYFINQTLRLDPNFGLLLAPLAEKNICIICSDFPTQTLYLSFDNNLLQLSTQSNLSVDCTISGPLIGLLTLAIQKQQADFRTCNIKITGDNKVAEHMQILLFKLDLDWEEALSKHVGDAVAHKALYIIKSLRQQQKHSHISLEQMISEYLQEDSGLLPTHDEIDIFMHDVDSLRMDVDRLDARIKAYASD